MSNATLHRGELSVLRDAHGRMFLLYAVAHAPRRAAPPAPRGPAVRTCGDPLASRAERLAYVAALVAAVAVVVLALLPAAS